MPRTQLVVSPEDRERFFHQARQERMTLSAWLAPPPTTGSGSSKR